MPNRFAAEEIQRCRALSSRRTEKVHHDPLAHFLLGQALAGMKEYDSAAQALRAAISFNPNFPEAHARLAALLELASASRNPRVTIGGSRAV